MNIPRAVIDNESCKNETVIQVDSADKPGKLLEIGLKPELCTTDRVVPDVTRIVRKNSLPVTRAEKEDLSHLVRRSILYSEWIRLSLNDAIRKRYAGFRMDRSIDEWVDTAKLLLVLAASAFYASSSTFARVANGLAFVVLLVAFLLRHTAGGAATTVLVKFGALGCAAGVLAAMAKDLPQEYILVPIVAFLLIAAVVARAR